MLNRLGTPQLLVAALLLLGGGLVMVFSASAVRASIVFGSSGTYLLRQLAALAIGVLVAFTVSRIPCSWLERLAYLAWAGAVALILATFTPLGLEENGARRWLAVGPIVFQPLEPAKLGVILALARWLASQQHRMDDFRASILVPGLLAGIPAGLLLLQPDFGGAVLILAFTGILVFTAGVRLDHLGATALAALPVVIAVGFHERYRVLRFLSFLDPWADPRGAGYQIVQSQIAFGTGGLTGVGFGASQQKLGYLPEAHTDFILSVIGEETGLVGVTAVLVCFALVGLASLGIASRAKGSFATLLAIGASLPLWLQALVNAGVAMGVLPTKGTTLPFLSYGGSSLVTSLAAFGLVLNVARPARRGRTGWR
jgi:cell division protein FtsW